MTRAGRLRALTLYLIPLCFGAWLYAEARHAWFQADDFAWLGLRDMIESPGDLWRVFFTPMAQGTVRPLSERLYFILLSEWFGFNAVPYRIWAFVVQAANLILIAAIARQLTGSTLAGVLAPMLWSLNLSLLYLMTWNSAYNQVACAFFLLLAFCLLLRYQATGQRRFWIGQWTVFLLGFGVMELNVVYPALALGYAWLEARSLVKRVLPMFAPSLLYLAAHRLAAPATPAPGYAMYWDASIFQTLWAYWQWAFNTTRYAAFMRVPVWWGVAAFWVLSLALLLFVAGQARRRNHGPLFGLVWFLVTLAPVLPLRDHLTEYYPAIPAIGLAWAAASAGAAAWQAAWPWRAAAGALLAVYVLASVNPLRISVRRQVELSQRVKAFVGGVTRAAQLHPGRTILITDLDPQIFWLGMLDRPFRLVGIEHVYLTPEAAARIAPRPQLGDIAEFALPAAAALAALERGTAVVYSAEEPRLKNVTALYAAQARSRYAGEQPRRLDAGSPLFSAYFLSGWYPADSGVRWSGKQARFRIGGPRNQPGQLVVSGRRPSHPLWSWPVRLRVGVDGQALPEQVVPPGDFRFVYDLPPAATGRPVLEVTVEVDRTFTPPEDGRPLGLAFSVFEVR